MWDGGWVLVAAGIGMDGSNNLSFHPVPPFPLLFPFPSPGICGVGSDLSGIYVAVVLANLGSWIVGIVSRESEVGSQGGKYRCFILT